MLHTIAPLVLDGTAAGLGAHVATQTTYVAAPIWDVVGNLKGQGISLAVGLLLAGIGIVAAWKFFMDRDKTASLKVLAIGVVVVGVVYALPSLGGVSRDTFTTVVR